MLSTRFVSTVARCSALVSLVLFAAPRTAHATTATTTTLTISSGGSPVTSVKAGTVVTLTATVNVGSAPVSPGLVEFCDANAKYCEDIHIVGTAQLTAAGTAVFKFRPGAGSHIYKAMFVGTNLYAASASRTSSLSVGLRVTMTTLTPSVGSGVFQLNAVVAGAGATGPGPSGQVSFLDASNGNALLGTATLGTPTLKGMAMSNLAGNATGDQPQGIAIADFNGDGIPDIAIPNYVSDSVTVLLGNGDGTFTPAASLATGIYPTTIATADFNGDGIPDLAVAHYQSNIADGSVTVYLGKGDGTFTPVSSSLATGATPYAIAVADFNGDGIPDMAVANEVGLTVTILLGNGDGTFTPASSDIAFDPSFSDPTGIVAADFNGDGMQDLAVVGVEGSVLVFEGHGDGTFTPFGSAIPVAIYYPGWIVSADFNHDGIPDLAVTGFDANYVVILLGLGNGSFIAGPVPNGTANATAVAVGDFNGDGIPDLVGVASQSNQQPLGATVYLGAGDGTFSVASTVAFPYVLATSVTNAAASDLNGDGFPDLVATGSLSQGPGPGQAYVALIEPQYSSSTAATSVAATPGTTAIQASYAGDSNWASSVSNVAIVQATLISPAPNSVLTGPTATFTWSQAVGTADYRLWLGTTQGSGNLFQGATDADANSITAKGLPIDGKTIYARLYTDFPSGASPYVDYTFTASTQSSLSSPAPGSVLTGSTATFQWTASGGASDYVLRLGTTAGAYDIDTTGGTTNTSATFSNLPINGETIHARLYTIYPTAYVYTDYVFTAAEVQAAMSSPTPGAVLPGTRATFQWTAGGAISYSLQLGTTVGANDIYDSGKMKATSVTFSPLPTNGETIYARLCSYFTTGSGCSDYVYTAATQMGAAMTSPAPNSVLPGSNVTFQWTSGTGATGYVLRLGTTAGGNDIRGTDTIKTTSITFSPLPTNGETIYARLYTLYAAGSSYTDYVYTAPTQARAAMTSPAPSSVLSGTQVTFQWTAGTGATSYTLRLGTTPGSGDIRGTGAIKATSVTFSPLPTNGETIYARLYTNYAAGSAYADYVYTAATQTAATLTSPAPNSTLPGSNVTFQWTASAGATSYILRLGTTVGGYDIRGTGKITATSRSFSGLPTNGETIYARLYTIFPSGAIYHDYVFTAAP